MKKALIFGVTGQDGSYLSDLLLDKGYRVVGLIRRSSTSNTSRIDHQKNNDNLVLIEGDITDNVSVRNIISEYRPHEIYNLAAQSHVKTSFDQPIYTWAADGEAVISMLEAIRQHSPHSKFYQASTSEMFGKNFSCVSGRKFQSETTEFVPQSPYAIAKLAAHHSVRLYREAYGLFACSGILFNHESERRGELFVTRKITKWVSEFDQWRKKTCMWRDTRSKGFSCSDEDIIYKYNGTHETMPKLRLGNLDAYRDWGHAEDYVRGMWMMLQDDAADDFVLATGKAHSVRDFLDEAFSFISVDDWSNYVMIDPEFYRPAEVDYLLGEAGKARLTLGWKPSVSFSELVERMVRNDVQRLRTS